MEIAQAANDVRTLARQFEALKKVVDVLDNLGALENQEAAAEVRIANLRDQEAALTEQNRQQAAEITLADAGLQAAREQRDAVLKQAGEQAGSLIAKAQAEADAIVAAADAARQAAAGEITQAREAASIVLAGIEGEIKAKLAERERITSELAALRERIG